MKKNFLFVMAAAAMLASCSKDAPVPEQTGNGNENGVVDPTNPNSPVKIQLGASADIEAGVELDKKASRAPIDAWNNTEVGIYALAKDAEATDWTTTNTNDPTMLWENVKGTIATGAEDTDVAITLDLQGQPGYYPNQGTHQYTFYGYHPYNADVNEPVIDGTKATTSFTITGAEDILHGSAVATQLNGKDDDAESTYEGYNATYFRKGNGAVTPVIKFGHKLTQLKFEVKKSDTFDAEQGLKVQSIVIKDVPTKLDLVIADKAGGTEGQISANAEPANGDLTVAGLEEAFDVSTATDFTEVGSPIMLFSDGTNTKNFTALVTLVDGENKTSPNTITLTAPAGNAYAQGSAYTIQLTINSLQEITVNANLTPWTEVEEPITGEI